MRQQSMTLQATESILAQSRHAVEVGGSRIGKNTLRMIDTHAAGRISSEDLRAIINGAHSRVHADVEPFLEADIRNTISPRPSEVSEALMAIRLGQYALTDPNDLPWRQHELQEMRGLLDEHGRVSDMA